MLTSWVWPSRSSDIHTLEYSVIFGCLSSSRLIVAISRAVVTCPSASSPVALTKWVLVISSCWARSFIRPTNASSLPAIISASATDASLALEIAVAFKRSSTVICSPALNQIWLPPIDSACSEQVTMSSIEMRPSSSASMTSSSVITLVIDAGRQHLIRVLLKEHPPALLLDQDRRFRRQGIIHRRRRLKRGHVR